MTPDLRSALTEPDLLLMPARTLVDAVARPGWAVLVRNGRFDDVGPAAELLLRHPDVPRLDLPGHLLMPGFVDTHHHLTQSFGKAIAFGEPSEIFRRIWVPLEQQLDEDDLHIATRLAALEALRGGFTTVCEAGTRSRAALQALRSSVEAVGLRCVLGRICNDVDLEPDAAREVLQAAEAHLASRQPRSLVHPSLAVSIPEQGTNRMLAQVSGLCREAGTVFQTHVNEHLVSVERSLVATGLRPLQKLQAAGAITPQLLAAHCTLVTPSELALLREGGAAVSYNPVASSWKGNAIAPALQMASLGIRMGLGTDGTRGDAFRLMDAAETAQRLTVGLQTGDFSVGAGWTWLAAATIGAADAAGLAGVTGDIAVGLEADYLLVDLEVPELTPSWDLGWELVRLANRSQIDAVVVQGRLRLWQGWPIDWDAPALLREARERAARAVAAAPLHRVHPRSDQARRT